MFHSPNHTVYFMKLSKIEYTEILYTVSSVVWKGLTKNKLVEQEGHHQVGSLKTCTLGSFLPSHYVHFDRSVHISRTALFI